MVGIACLNTAMKNAPLRNSSVPSLCITSSPFHFLFTLRFDKLSDPGGQCLMKCTRRTLTRFDRLFDRSMCISSSTIYAFRNLYNPWNMLRAQVYTRNILLNHPKISNATRPSNLHVSEIPHALRVFASRIA